MGEREHEQEERGRVIIELQEGKHNIKIKRTEGSKTCHKATGLSQVDVADIM